MKLERFSNLCLDPYIVGPWVAQRTNGTWAPGRGAGIGKIKDGKLVAGALYEDWNGSSVICHIAGEGLWADRHYLAVIFDYPFNQIGANKIIAPVCSTNQKSIDMLEHMGFNQEAKLHGATSKGDLLFFVMDKEDCKYLRGRYGKTIECAAAA